MSIPKTLNLRPIRVVGITTAVHSIIYGIGYLSGIGGFDRTIIYPAVSEIMRPEFFGLVLLIVGLLVGFSYLYHKVALLNYVSTVQSIIWLFVSFVYFLEGAYLLGLAFGMIWTFLSGYCSYSYINKDRIIDDLVMQRVLEY